MRAQGRRAQDHPHVAPLGLEADGVWISSAAKIYPARLCQFLAATALEGIIDRFPRFRPGGLVRFLGPLRETPDWTDRPSGINLAQTTGAQHA
eukprot:455058-Pyramimonas_sp.AAC.1